MKRCLSLILLVAAASLASAQNSITLHRNYKVGDADSYKMTMHIEGGQSADISSTYTETVKKVYDNGDADIELKYESMTYSMNGTTFPAPKQALKTITMRYNSMGMPAETGNNRMGGDISAYAAMIPKGPIAVGDTFPVDETDKQGTHTTGTVKLSSIDAGIATVDVDVAILRKGDTTPMHVKATTKFDAADSKLESTEGDAADIPMGPNRSASMHFTVERVKS